MKQINLKFDYSQTVCFTLKVYALQNNDKQIHSVLFTKKARKNNSYISSETHHKEMSLFEIKRVIANSKSM